MLNHTRTPKNQQQKFFEKSCKKFSHMIFYDYMMQGIIVKIIDEFLPSYRKRIYTPLKTLSLFIEQVLKDNGSCQKSVNQVAVKTMMNNPDSVFSTNTGGYCKARHRLSLDFIRTLTYRIADFIEEKVPEPWLWNGLCVKVVDGTTAQCPDTKENQAEYPQPSSQKEAAKRGQTPFLLCLFLPNPCRSSVGAGPCACPEIGHPQGGAPTKPNGSAPFSRIKICLFRSENIHDQPDHGLLLSGIRLRHQKGKGGKTGIIDNSFFPAIEQPVVTVQEIHKQKGSTSNRKAALRLLPSTKGWFFTMK